MKTAQALLAEMIKALGPVAPDPRDMLGLRPMGLYGMDVHVNDFCDPKPRFQLMPATVAVMSPEKAAEINAWLADFFGWSEPLNLVIGSKHLFIGPRAYQSIVKMVDA